MDPTSTSTTGFGQADPAAQTLAAIRQSLAAMGITGPRLPRPGTMVGQGQDAHGAPMPGSGGSSGGGGGGGGDMGSMMGGGKSRGSGSGFRALVKKLGGMFGQGASGLMNPISGKHCLYLPDRTGNDHLTPRFL